MADENLVSKKAPAKTAGAFSLDHSNIDGAELALVFRIGFCFERDLLAFLQLLEAFALNGGEVDKDITTAIVIGDEAVALFGIKPFNSTVQHSENLPHFEFTQGNGALPRVIQIVLRFAVVNITQIDKKVNNK